MAKKLNIDELNKITSYTIKQSAYCIVCLVGGYSSTSHGYVELAMAFFMMSSVFLIIIVVVLYTYYQKSNYRLNNSVYTMNTGRKIGVNSGRSKSFALSIPNLIKNKSNSTNMVDESKLYIDHLDFLFTTRMNGSVKQFAGWILWKFLHIGEYLQIKIDAEYSNKSKKPPGAFSRKTWSNTRWDGKDYRYNFTWSQNNWAMVYRTLITGCLEFKNATGISIATGLGEGETLRLSRGAGYVYECVATTLLPQWDWLMQIRTIPQRVGTGTNRSG